MTWAMTSLIAIGFITVVYPIMMAALTRSNAILRIPGVWFVSLFIWGVYRSDNLDFDAIVYGVGLFLSLPGIAFLGVLLVAEKTLIAVRGQMLAFLLGPIVGIAVPSLVYLAILPDTEFFSLGIIIGVLWAITSRPVFALFQRSSDVFNDRQPHRNVDE
jgi:hypothetical protein